MQRQLKSKAGLSIVELLTFLMVVGILSAVYITNVQVDYDDYRYTETLAEINLIRNALVGDPELSDLGLRNDFGFLGDIGRLPTQSEGLQILITNAGLTAYTIHPESTLGYGWRGPYMTELRQGQDLLKDSWGNNYVYTNNGSDPPSLKSLGADGVTGGTGLNQDIILTFGSDTILGDLHGTLLNERQPYFGTADVELVESDADGGTLTKTYTIEQDEEGYFKFENLSYGRKSVKVYLPSKENTKLTLGPSIATVDRKTSLLRPYVFDFIMGSLCLAGIFTITSATYSTSGNYIYIYGTVTRDVDIDSFLILTNNTSLGVSQFRVTRNGSGNKTFNCSGSVQMDPCPASQGSQIGLTPTWEIQEDNNIRFIVNFSSSLSYISYFKFKIFYDGGLGCDELEISN